MDFDLDKIIGGIKIEGVNPYAEAEDENWNDVPLWISTGCVSLDYAIGGFQRGFRGGIPVGKVVEINGLESTGKSVLLDHIIRETCQVGGAFFLCDAEHAHLVHRMNLIGCDLKNFRFIEKPRKDGGDGEEEVDEASLNVEQRSKNKGKQDKKKTKTKVADDVVLEEFFDIAEKTVVKFRKNVSDEVPIVFGLDSLAAIETADQAATDDPNMKAKIDTSVVMSAYFKGFCSAMAANNATLVIVNQLRSKIGVMYGDPLYSYGGGTKDYHFSIRIRMEKGTQIKTSDDPGRTAKEFLNEDVAGMQFKGQVVKNKLAEPWRKFRMPLYFDYRGIWHEQCFAQLVIDREKWRFSENLQKKSNKNEGEGNTYYWKGKKIGTKEVGLIEAFVDDPKLMYEMEEELFLQPE